jgi:hypothetical protein
VELVHEMAPSEFQAPNLEIPDHRRGSTVCKAAKLKLGFSAPIGKPARLLVGLLANS